MTGINYNAEQEAFELDYELWDKQVVVRFYVEDQQEIMDDLADIAKMLDKVNRNKQKIAEVILRDNWAGSKKYLAESRESFVKGLYIDSCSVEIDEDMGIVVGLLVGGSEGSLKGLLSIELGEDSGLEILGWAE